MSLALLLCVGLALRLVFCYYAFVLERDSVTYISVSQKICSGDFSALSTVYSPPLYFLLMAGISKIFCIPAWIVGLGISLFAGVGTALLGEMICRKITGRRTIAFCAAILLLTNPALFKISCSILRDSLYLLLSFACFRLFAEWIDISRQWLISFLGGICCGAGIVTRFEGIELLILALVFSGALFFSRKCGIAERSKIILGNLISYLFGAATIILSVFMISAKFQYPVSRVFLYRYCSFFAKIFWP